MPELDSRLRAHLAENAEPGADACRRCPDKQTGRLENQPAR